MGVALRSLRGAQRRRLAGDSFGWYDLTIRVGSDATFLRQFAGNVETGSDSVTYPAIAAAAARLLPQTSPAGKSREARILACGIDRVAGGLIGSDPVVRED